MVKTQIKSILNKQPAQALLAPNLLPLDPDPTDTNYCQPGMDTAWIWHSSNLRIWGKRKAHIKESQKFLMPNTGFQKQINHHDDMINYLDIISAIVTMSRALQNETN